MKQEKNGEWVVRPSVDQAVNLACAEMLHRTGKMPRWMYYLDWLKTPAEIFSIELQRQTNLPLEDGKKI